LLLDLSSNQAANIWNNRYFVLELGKLTYYEKPSDEPPYGISEKGSIPSLKGKKVIDNGVSQYESVKDVLFVLLLLFTAMF